MFAKFYFSMSAQLFQAWRELFKTWRELFGAWRKEDIVSFLMLLIGFIPGIELSAALLLTKLFSFYVMTESNNALIFKLNEFCCTSHIDLLTAFIEKNYIHSLEKSIS